MPESSEKSVDIEYTYEPECLHCAILRLLAARPGGVLFDEATSALLAVIADLAAPTICTREGRAEFARMVGGALAAELAKAAPGAAAPRRAHGLH